MNKIKNASNIELLEYYDIQEEELYKNKNTMPSSAYAIIEIQGKFLIGYRFRAVYNGQVDSLMEFDAWENDEMLSVRVWDFCDKSIYVDQVDTKMVEILMQKNRIQMKTR